MFEEGQEKKEKSWTNKGRQIKLQMQNVDICSRPSPGLQGKSFVSNGFSTERFQIFVRALQYKKNFFKHGCKRSARPAPEDFSWKDTI